MKRKGLVIALSLVFVLSLNGCIQKYNYSQQQSEMGAEYMASLLMEHDDNFQGETRLTYEESAPTQIPEEDGTATIQKKSTPTQAPKENESTIGKQGSNLTPSADMYTLTDVIGQADFEITYSGYELFDSYPKNEAASYFTLTPKENNQLLVVSFKAKNKSKQDKLLNLNKSDISYLLKLGASSEYRPLYTLLEYDLQNMNASIKGKKTKTLYLVFEVLKEDITDVSLQVSKDEKVVEIDMK